MASGERDNSTISHGLKYVYTLKKLIDNMFSAMYCMFDNNLNNSPSQNSERVSGDSNADIDGENVPENIKLDYEFH